LKLKIPIFDKLRGKINILSTHHLLHWKRAAVCWKNCNFLLPNFCNPRSQQHTWNKLTKKSKKF